jgi:hypothetical protein
MLLDAVEETSLNKGNHNIPKPLVFGSQELRKLDFLS